MRQKNGQRFWLRAAMFLAVCSNMLLGIVACSGTEFPNPGSDDNSKKSTANENLPMTMTSADTVSVNQNPQSSFATNNVALNAIQTIPIYSYGFSTCAAVVNPAMFSADQIIYYQRSDGDSLAPDILAMRIKTSENGIELKIEQNSLAVGQVMFGQESLTLANNSSTLGTWTVLKGMFNYNPPPLQEITVDFLLKPGLAIPPHAITANLANNLGLGILNNIPLPEHSGQNIAGEHLNGNYSLPTMTLDCQERLNQQETLNIKGTQLNVVHKRWSYQYAGFTEEEKIVLDGYQLLDSQKIEKTIRFSLTLPQRLLFTTTPNNGLSPETNYTFDILEK